MLGKPELRAEWTTAEHAAAAPCHLAARPRAWGVHSAGPDFDASESERVLATGAWESA